MNLHGTIAEDELLGTMSDRKLANQLGRTLVAVRTRRVAKQIPVFDPQVRP
jgi:hypothetical protein